jgi:NAD(P)-dependent dehydrogenase (short-subunit alcohol dehydrogenase family)
VVREARSAGGQAEFVCVDARELSGVRRAIDYVNAAHGRLDILVNNAATSVPKSILESTEADYELVFDLNVRSVFFAMKWAAEAMVEDGRGGSIINLCSIAATRGLGSRALYCGTKAAVLQMTRASALDLAPHRIRANCISPGMVDTDQFREMRIQDRDQENALIAEIGARQPLGRIGAPADIAAAAVYFGSDESEWVTGANLAVDGGGFI